MVHAEQGGPKSPMPDINMRIGVLVRVLREEQGLTQKDLAEMVSLTPGSISHIETMTRGRQVKLDTLQNIARAVGLSSLSEMIARAEQVGIPSAVAKEAEAYLTKLKRKLANVHAA